MRHLAAVLVLALASCASMDQHIRDTMCDADGAFQEGMNEGRAGRDMDHGFTSACDPSERAAARAAYRDGYQAGLAARAADRPAVVVAAPPRWDCEVRAFGDTFTATDATESGAGAAARALCRDKHGELFCRDSTCTQGE